MKSSLLPVGFLSVVLAASGGCTNDADAPVAPVRSSGALVSASGTTVEGVVLELGERARLLKTGEVRLTVRFGCAEGLEVLEAHVSVTQSTVSGQAGLPVQCTGRLRTFHVTVSALEGTFQPGTATVSAFALVIDPATSQTQQAQDSQTVQLS